MNVANSHFRPGALFMASSEKPRQSRNLPGSARFQRALRVWRPARGVPELPGTRRKILARLRRTFGLFVQMNTDLCLSVFICGFILFSVRIQKMREILV